MQASGATNILVSDMWLFRGRPAQTTTWLQDGGQVHRPVCASVLDGEHRDLYLGVTLLFIRMWFKEAPILSTVNLSNLGPS